MTFQNAALPARCADCRIRSVGLCTTLSEEEFSRLSEMATIRNFAAGQMIRIEGEAIQFYANLIDGVAKKVKSTADGREQIVGLLYEGDLLDEVFCEVAPSTIEAVSDIRLCCYPKRTFEDLVRAEPHLEHRLLRLAMGELRQAQDQMLLLGRMTAREKVASFLLDLSRRAAKQDCPRATKPDVGSPPAGQRAIPIPVSRAVIADYLGLTTETVCRQMTGLRQDGIISLPDNHSFTLVDPGGLATQAGGE